MAKIIIFHLKKDTEKVVLLQVKGVIQIIVKFRAKRFSCMFLSCTKNTAEGHKKLCRKSNFIATF